MINKFERRRRRARKTRAKIREKGKNRLSVFRSANHIYAQVIDDAQGHTLVSASTLDKEVAQSVSRGGNSEAARKVGEVVARRAKEAGIEDVAFDRGGYKYHGRVQALAEGARENGLDL
jgi:large subunit ribosomal protein L18